MAKVKDEQTELLPPGQIIARLKECNDQTVGTMSTLTTALPMIKDTIKKGQYDAALKMLQIAQEAVDNYNRVIYGK